MVGYSADCLIGHVRQIGQCLPAYRHTHPTTSPPIHPSVKAYPDTRGFKNMHTHNNKKQKDGRQRVAMRGELFDRVCWLSLSLLPFCSFLTKEKGFRSKTNSYTYNYSSAYTNEHTHVRTHLLACFPICCRVTDSFRIQSNLDNE